MSESPTEAQTVTATVDVAANPNLTFKVFTEEMHLWWQQGAINFHDSSRALSNRMEPGVGGRIMEVYDDNTGDGLELARITIWEPGTRLVFKGSIDDVTTEVTFTPHAGGTRVNVAASIPAGGHDRGSTSFTRMTPNWFGGWMARRNDVAHEPATLGRVITTIRYQKPARMGRWLRDVYGFWAACEIPDDDVSRGDHTWYELHVGDAPIVLFEHDGVPDSQTFESWIFVDDLEARRATIAAAGGEVTEIVSHGARTFTTTDPEGLRWTFAQASPQQLGR